jgi:hypothetical protein
VFARLSPLLAAIAVFLTSLGAALRLGLHGTDGRLIYALDDTYIHMAVAKTLATHGVWGCTPFHFSSSSSSLLWTVVLGGAYRVFGVNDWLPLALNVAFAVATLVVANAALARLGTAPLLRGAALVGIVVAFPMAGMVLIGMEHILHLLLTIAFAAVAVETLAARPDVPTPGPRRTLALSALAALLAASRYEGFFPVGLACVALLARRRLLPAATVGLAALAPAAAFGVYSVTKGAYFLPNPLMVKAVGEDASMLSRILQPFGSEDVEFLLNNRAMPILLVLGALAALAGWRRRGVWKPTVVFPLLLAGTIVLHGHFVFSPLYWAYRYDAYLVGFGLFVAAVVLSGVPSPTGLPRGALPALAVAALVPLLADVREGLLPDAEIRGMRGTYLEQYQSAQFINRYHPADAVIVNDLGAVTYYTGARILDLVGLGDVEPLRIMRRSAYTGREVTEWTAPFRPKLAIVSLGWSVAGALIPREWVRVAVLEVPPDRHRVGLFAVDPRDAWVVRASVAQHFGPLTRTPGYVLRLRRAEDVDAAVAGRPAAAPEAPRPTRS